MTGATPVRPLRHRTVGRVATAAVAGLVLGCSPTLPLDGPGSAAEAPVDDRDGADAPDPDADAAGAFAAVVDALEAPDLDALVARSAGPAAAFFAWIRHVDDASAEALDPFEDLVVEPREPEVVVDDDRARISTTITYTAQEGRPIQALTDFELRRVDDRWYLAGFERNGVAIAEWVTPAPADATASRGGIDVEVLGSFVDVSCLDGSDASCPGALQDAVAVAFVVTNATGGELAPVAVDTGGGEAAGVLDAGGSEWPLVYANVTGFPPAVASTLVVGFQGAGSLGAGGVVRLAWETEDGAVHRFELPVPSYPHDWAADGW